MSEGSSFQSVNFNFPMKMQSQFVSWDAPENPTNKIVLKANG